MDNNHSTMPVLVREKLGLQKWADGPRLHKEYRRTQTTEDTHNMFSERMLAVLRKTRLLTYGQKIRQDFIIKFKYFTEVHHSPQKCTFKGLLLIYRIAKKRYQMHKYCELLPFKTHFNIFLLRTRWYLSIFDG